MRTFVRLLTAFIVIIFISGYLFYNFHELFLNEKNPNLHVTPTPTPTSTPAPTPISCNGRLTPQSIEGPYYKSGSPERTKLYDEDTTGAKLVLSGYILDANCQPIQHAWLDFWQANGNGEYNIEGYSLRGHQYTDSSGRYEIQTVVPGEYPGRTPHIHVKVQANPNSPLLTTQIFIPGVSNSTDPLYQTSLVMDIHDTFNGKSATFNFVVAKQ